MRKTSPPATAIPWRPRGDRAAKGDDDSYYGRRALEEQVMAERATCDAARECHDQLAAMYRFRAAPESTDPQSCESPAQEEATTAA